MQELQAATRSAPHHICLLVHHAYSLEFKSLRKNTLPEPWSIAPAMNNIEITGDIFAKIGQHTSKFP
eukprot:8660369-Ditylum_brightwellii.AAC.1